MSTIVRVTRVVVDSWPGGEQWDRWYHAEGYGQGGYENPAPAWLLVLAEADEVGEFERRTDGSGYGPLPVDDVMGWVLPNPIRRHWFSRAAALEWARRARMLGAVVRVETSKPVEWGCDE